MESYEILLVEDMRDLLEYNRKALEERGYHVMAAETLEQAGNCCAARSPDLIVLDIMLPDGNGIEFCRQLREMSAAPVLFLTSLGESEEIVRGLRAGGDDYITKPYRIEELVARIEAHLRRMELSRRAEAGVRLGGLLLDPKMQRAFLNGNDLLLKPKEYLLLATLIRNHHRYTTAGELYAEVWGMSSNEDVRTVLVHISNLRSKLRGKLEEGSVRIERRGAQGYRLICGEEP